MTMSHKVGTGAFDNVGNALAVDTVATSTFTAPAHLAGYTGTVTNKNYVNLEGGNTLVEYGGVGQIEVEGFETSYKVVYNPPTRDERWKLPAGESMDRTSTSTTTSTVLGITTSETVTIRERITYHGRETVTVPAGTFQTCKFSITDLDDTLQPSYEWTQVGTGLVVKGTSWEEDSGETLMELTHSSL